MSPKRNDSGNTTGKKVALDVKILDGKWLAKQFEREIKRSVDAGLKQGARAPGLGVILVGEDKASKVYVKNKERTAERCGFLTREERLPADAAEKDVLAVIEQFNSAEDIDGILLQLPLPKHLDSDSILQTILPEKDADGLHPINQGLLVSGQGVLRSCTPSGIMRLIDLALSDHEAQGELDVLSALPEVDLSGKSALVIGRSILVGKPVAFMLLERNATVTVAHSRTADLPKIARESDIIVAAVGREEMVKGDWVKEGAIVIDVGINRTEAGSLVGDVDFDGAASRAAAITPVPGGVGPMTVIMLMQNTLCASTVRASKENQ